MKPFHYIRHCKRAFTSEEWGEYCGQQERIETTFGRYTFNDFDICINPDKMTIEQKGGAYGYYATIKIAECGNGLWVYGIDYSSGTGGGGYGASWEDKEFDKRGRRVAYKSEVECRQAACDACIKTLLSAMPRTIDDIKGCTGKNIRQLIAKIEDYKKSLTRPKITQLELF